MKVYLKWLRAIILGLVIVSITLIAFSPVNAAPANVQLMIRTDKTTYESRELVQVFLLLWNGGSSAVTVQLAPGCLEGFVVEDLNGTNLYNQTLPVSECSPPFSNPTNYLTLYSGQTYSFADVWNQTDSTGKQVPTDRSYLIKGLLPTVGNLTEPITIVNITSEAETPVDASIDTFTRFYQDTPVSLALPIFVILVGFYSSRKFQKMKTGRESWFILPIIATTVAALLLYETISFPEYFQGGYLRYPFSQLLQTLTVVSMALVGPALLISLINIEFNPLPRISLVVATNATLVSILLAASNLNILSMEWRTFLEYDWGASLLNSLVGYFLGPLSLGLAIRAYSQKVLSTVVSKEPQSQSPAKP